MRRAVPFALILAACPPPFPIMLTSTGAEQTSGTTAASSSGPADDTSGAGGSTSSGSGSGSGADASTAPDPPDTTTGGSSGAEPFCGDGVVDPGEECDDGNLIAADACHLCGRKRIVFATSMLLQPDQIGGLALADGLCRQLAAKAGLANWQTFTAWLSDSKTDARNRIYRGKGLYVRTDDVPVAANADQFFSGELLAPIGLDETGMPVLSGQVWTGTRPDGTAVPDAAHCGDWTDDHYLSITGYFGHSTEIDARWTFEPLPEFNPTSCASEGHLYCIEGK